MRRTSGPRVRHLQGHERSVRVSLSVHGRQLQSCSERYGSRGKTHFRTRRGSDDPATVAAEPMEGVLRTIVPGEIRSDSRLLASSNKKVETTPCKVADGCDWGSPDIR